MRPASYLWLSMGGLAVQALVGLAGFVLHAQADLQRSAPTLLDKLLSGAPPMAPLLFPNLVVLGLIALAAMWDHSVHSAENGHARLRGGHHLDA